MKIVSTLDCEIHDNEFDCPDVLIHYIEKFDEYGIIYHDGGTSIQVINYCPFCGSKLPASRRDLWFETLAKLGYDDPADQEIPEEFGCDKWYKNRKLK